MNLDLRKCEKTLIGILHQLSNLPKANLSDFNKGESALVIVDLVNGFVSEGALQSPRVAGIVPTIRNLMQEFFKREIPVVVFADTHNEESPEFEVYPPHCLTGTSECAVVAELESIGTYTLMPKNSTNGFLEPEFQAWLKANPTVKNFVVVGDCTDICIEQFAKTLKAYFNMVNARAKVVVPVEAVETFDLEATNHYAELMNLMALYGMMGAGVTVVAGIDTNS